MPKLRQHRRHAHPHILGESVRSFEIWSAQSADYGAFFASGFDFTPKTI